jgi:hypothetical protein
VPTSASVFELVTWSGFPPLFVSIQLRKRKNKGAKSSTSDTVYGSVGSLAGHLIKLTLSDM